MLRTRREALALEVFPVLQPLELQLLAYGLLLSQHTEYEEAIRALSGPIQVGLDSYPHDDSESKVLTCRRWLLCASYSQLA